MTVKWIAVDPGLPANIRTEDIAYTLVGGEVSFSTNPTNTQLNTAFAGRVAAIQSSIDSVYADIGFDFSTNVPYVYWENAMLGDTSYLLNWDLANQSTRRASILTLVALADGAIATPVAPKIAFSGVYSDLTGKPSLATVATSGSYTDLINKPTLDKAYQGTTLKTGVFPIFKSATVASSVAVFHLTSDGTSSGTALFPTGPITESLNAFVSDATASYQMSAAWSNSNKTVTVTANKLTTSNILTGILGQAAANGSVVNLQVYGN